MADSSIGALGSPTRLMSLISDVRSDNLRLVDSPETVRDVALSYAQVEARVPMPAAPPPPRQPPYNPTVARLISLNVGAHSTVYSTRWPGHILEVARSYGADFTARNLGDNAWRVERVR